MSQRLFVRHSPERLRFIWEVISFTRIPLAHDQAKFASPCWLQPQADQRFPPAHEGVVRTRISLSALPWTSAHFSNRKLNEG